MAGPALSANPRVVRDAPPAPFLYRGSQAMSPDVEGLLTMLGHRRLLRGCGGRLVGLVPHLHARASVGLDPGHEHERQHRDDDRDEDRPDAGRHAVPLEGIRPINVPDFHEILDRVHFGSVMVDERGIITFLSQPYAEFLGVKREEAVGRHVTEVIENTRMHIVVQLGELEIGKQRVRGQDLPAEVGRQAGEHRDGVGAERRQVDGVCTDGRK